MTPAEALARIREIVERCGSPGCVACPREIKATVGEVDEQAAMSAGRVEWLRGVPSVVRLAMAEAFVRDGLITPEQALLALNPPVPTQESERTETLAAEVHRLRQEVARLRAQVKP